MHKVTICIPIFNEELNIEPLFNDILNSKLYDNVEQIIFIDDKSTDNSILIIEKIEEIHSKVKLIKLEKNHGQSYCLYTGAKKSLTNVIATIDGDCQNPPFELLKLIKVYFNDENLKNNIKLVSGIRHDRKDSMTKRLSSIFANKVRQWILGDNCEDTGCSLKVFDRIIFLQNDFFTGIHRFIPSLFEGKNHKAIYRNVTHEKRKFGTSKYNNIYRLVWGIRDIIKVKRMLSND